MEQMMEVYVVIHKSLIFQRVLSLHETYSGARNAKEKHKQKAKNEYYESSILKNKTVVDKFINPWEHGQAWFIRKMNLEN